MAAAARNGFRRMFSLSSFTRPPLPSPIRLRRSPTPTSSSPDGIVGLSKRTTSEGLREAFSKFGQVVHARVVTDRISGYSKGFGFVKYATLEDAAEGINGMNGKFLDGWVIFAEYARPRPPPSPPQNSEYPADNQYPGPPSSY